MLDQTTTVPDDNYDHQHDHDTSQHPHVHLTMEDRIDCLVSELVEALWETGQFTTAPNDDHILHSARVVLLQKMTTMTAEEVNSAIDRWVKRNDCLVNY